MSDPLRSVRLMTDIGPQGPMPKPSLFVALALALLLSGGTSAGAYAQPAGVPVSVAKTARQDMPIWLHGLGTVQANYAAAIRPRVDGTLTQVPVQEGQDVTKG